MQILRKNFPDHLRFLMWVHVSLLLMFTVFRAITLAVNRPEYLGSSERAVSIGEAFFIGFRFDILVASYALLLPYLILTAAFIFNWSNPRWFLFSRFYCSFIIIICLVISAADVPYFNFFNSRLTTIAVNWKNLGTVIHYIVREIKYYPFIIIGFLGIWGIGKWVRYIWKSTTTEQVFARRQKLSSTMWASLLMLIGLFGGATPKQPTMENAVFSKDGFINQLTLNPVQTWFDSYIPFNIYENLPLDSAKTIVRDIFGTTSNDCTSPVRREIKFKGKARRMNVVLVLMESMTMYRMGIFGNPHNLTPGLDSLARHSIFFKNCYSNGIHTNAGLYSTLFSMPVPLLRHPMNNGVSEFSDFSGLPTMLKSKGYETIFFCTHEKTFDNLDVFLAKNGFDQISDIEDYPDSLITNAWGVSDEHLFGYAHERLNKLAAEKKPFFATILTITAHPPYTFPTKTKFKPRSADQVEQCYEYADWSVKNFMESVSREKWYSNTVFVFVGDHGSNMPGPYDVPLSYNHVPLIIHAPSILKKPKALPNLANQTDIFPTVMGLLRMNYTQNTMSFDLFRERRPFAIFSQDTKLGVIDEQFLYIARKSGRETLFDYRTNFGQNIFKKHEAHADSMRNFACAQLQVAEWMVANKITSVKTACDSVTAAPSSFFKKK